MARPKSAQRRPALPGRQPRRSTRRASPEASAQRRPALPGRQPHPAGRPHRDHRSPLNEGRPFRAGNPHKPPQVYPIRVPRSTKAGPSGPATPVLVPLRGEGHVFRSTKAGPSGPATPAHSGHAWPSLSPLNEGRPFRAGNPPAVRREGQPSRRPLNEGRPFRAGNPGPLDRFSSIANVAQRRPALPGRQPTALRQRPRWHSQRSTKAGPSGPATPLRPSPVPIVRRGRSTKAGPSGPATPAEATAGSMLTTALNEGRPFRAGNPRQSRWAARQSSSLNEGRPFRAGNPIRVAELARFERQRSTKAGPSGPATPGLSTGCEQGRQRSTKAGPSGPATRSRPLDDAEGSTSLNEGRPFRAGNPMSARNHTHRPTDAQRRPALPGRQPRAAPRRGPARRGALNEGRPFRAGNPGSAGVRVYVRIRRSTKAGPSGPATPGTSTVATPLSSRSTKAGPSGPATLSRAMTPPVNWTTAQRRPALPGRQPSS